MNPVLSDCRCDCHRHPTLHPWPEVQGAMFWKVCESLALIRLVRKADHGFGNAELSWLKRYLGKVNGTRDHRTGENVGQEWVQGTSKEPSTNSGVSRQEAGWKEGEWNERDRDDHLVNFTTRRAYLHPLSLIMSSYSFPNILFISYPLLFFFSLIPLSFTSSCPFPGLLKVGLYFECLSLGLFF